MKLYQFALSFVLLSYVNFIGAMTIENNAPTRIYKNNENSSPRTVTDVKKLEKEIKWQKITLVNKNGSTVLTGDCHNQSHEYEEITFSTSPSNSHNRKVLPLVVCSQVMTDNSHIIEMRKKYEFSKLKTGYETSPHYGPCSDPNCKFKVN